MPFVSASQAVTTMTLSFTAIKSDGTPTGNVTASWSVSSIATGQIYQTVSPAAANPVPVVINNADALNFADPGGRALTITLTVGGVSRVFRYILSNPAGLR